MKKHVPIFISVGLILVCIAYFVYSYSHSNIAKIESAPLKNKNSAGVTEAENDESNVNNNNTSSLTQKSEALTDLESEVDKFVNTLNNYALSAEQGVPEAQFALGTLLQYCEFHPNELPTKLETLESMFSSGLIDQDMLEANKRDYEVCAAIPSQILGEAVPSVLAEAWIESAAEEGSALAILSASRNDQRVFDESQREKLIYSAFQEAEGDIYLEIQAIKHAMRFRAKHFDKNIEDLVNSGANFTAADPSFRDRYAWDYLLCQKSNSCVVEEKQKEYSTFLPVSDIDVISSRAIELNEAIINQDWDFLGLSKWTDL